MRKCLSRLKEKAQEKARREPDHDVRGTPARGRERKRGRKEAGERTTSGPGGTSKSGLMLCQTDGQFWSQSCCAEDLHVPEQASMSTLCVGHGLGERGPRHEHSRGAEGSSQSSVSPQRQP